MGMDKTLGSEEVHFGIIVFEIKNENCYVKVSINDD